jgi:hypothetical protein
MAKSGTRELNAGIVLAGACGGWGGGAVGAGVLPAQGGNGSGFHFWKRS